MTNEIKTTYFLKSFQSSIISGIQGTKYTSNVHCFLFVCLLSLTEKLLTNQT